MTRISFALATLAALASVTGCHRTSEKDLHFSLTPNLAAHTLTVTCRSSSSDKCRVSFTGDVLPSRADISVGSNTTFQNVTSDVRYCVEISSHALDTCESEPVPTTHQTIRRRTRVTSDSGE